MKAAAGVAFAAGSIAQICKRVVIAFKTLIFDAHGHGIR